MIVGQLLTLLGLHARRLRNLVTAGLARKARPGDASRRAPTRRKRKASLLLLLAAPLIVFQSGFISVRFVSLVVQPDDPAYVVSHQAMRRIRAPTPHSHPLVPELQTDRPIDMDAVQCRSLLQEMGWDELDRAEQEAKLERLFATYREHGEGAFAVEGPDPVWQFARRRTALSTGAATRLALAVLAVLAVCVLTGLGLQNRDIAAQQDPDRFFLAQPVRTRTLALAALLRYWLLHPWYWLVAVPFLVVTALFGHRGPTVWPTMMAAIIGFGLVQAGLRSWGEAALRRWPPVARRWGQAAATLGGMLVFLGLITVANLSLLPQWYHGAAESIAPALYPVAQVVRALVLEVDAPLLWAAAGGTVAAGLLAGWWGTRALGRYLIPVDADAALGGSRRRQAQRSWAGIGPGRKDRLLLLRDPRLLMQVFVVPAVVVAMNLITHLRGGLARGGDVRHLGAVCLGAGLYLVLVIAPQSLQLERSQLWLLAAQPRSLARQLRAKTVLWSACGLLYLVVGLLAVAWWFPDPRLAWYGLYGVAAIVSYVALCVPAGALGTDPFDVRPNRAVSISLMYALMLVLAAQIAALYAAPWALAVNLVIVAALAYGAWQRFGERERWLLDPTEAPPYRIDLLGAMSALWCFFAAQAVAVAILMAVGTSAHAAVTIGFAIAGILVALGCIVIFRRRRLADWARVCRLRAPGARSLWRDAVLGAGVGLLLGAAGLGWIWLLAHAGWRPPQAAVSLPLPWMLALAVVAAPLSEEFLFRGVLLRGLEASLRPAGAVVGCAVLFAIVHPPPAMVPVFLLGLATAMLARRRDWLVAPVMVHAVYNLIVVLAGSLMGG